MECDPELRPIGPGRYRGRLRLPWGREVAAEVLVGTRQGWSRRPEAADGRWTAYEVGPAVVAIRLLGGLEPPTPSPLPRRVEREPVGAVAGASRSRGGG